MEDQGGMGSHKRLCVSVESVVFGQSSKRKVRGLISRLPHSSVGICLGCTGFPRQGAEAPQCTKVLDLPPDLPGVAPLSLLS